MSGPATDGAGKEKDIMICTVIQGRDFDGIEELLGRCEMAEIRLDGCRLSVPEISRCFSSDVPLVATCRLALFRKERPELDEVSALKECGRRLIAAIEAGAAYVDIEEEAPVSMVRRVCRAAAENGTVVIRSYHDFDKTGSVEELRSVVEKCRRDGADIVKIATMAQSQDDVARVMSMYDDAESGTLLAFCMGEDGRESRIECLRRGAPFSYASVSVEECAAPGQWTAAEMSERVYGDFRFIGIDPGTTSDAAASATEDSTSIGPIRMPASKSFAQRAIVAAALADGVSTLSGYTPCGDSEAAVDAVSRLGAKVVRRDDVLEIQGISAAPDCIAPEEVHVGESGLLTRLMMPLLSVLSASDVTLTGEKTLLGRPMSGVTEILSGFSVSVEPVNTLDPPEAVETEKSPGKDGVRLPLKVSGPLVPGNAKVSGRNGSQIISGLLMALPLASGNSRLTVHDPKSIPYMYITLDVMRKFGVKVSNEMLGDRPFIESGGDWSYCTDIVFRIRGRQRYASADFRIEGDWSSAAAFLVAGAVFGRVELSGLDTASLQADLSIMDILMDAGASLSQLDGSTGTIAVQRAPLNAFSVDASNCPDLFPVISILAAFCQGQSRIGGTDRLAHKESDRAAAILGMLEKMGVEARIENNALVVEGQSLAQRILTGRLLRGGEYSSLHDHRMAMALAVAGLGADSPVTIDDTECVAKSFPAFFTLFSSL